MKDLQQQIDELSTKVDDTMLEPMQAMARAASHIDKTVTAMQSLIDQRMHEAIRAGAKSESRMSGSDKSLTLCAIALLITCTVVILGAVFLNQRTDLNTQEKVVACAQLGRDPIDCRTAITGREPDRR